MADAHIHQEQKMVNILIKRMKKDNNFFEIFLHFACWLNFEEFVFVEHTLQKLFTINHQDAPFGN